MKSDQNKKSDRKEKEEDKRVKKKNRTDIPFNFNIILSTLEY